MSVHSGKSFARKTKNSTAASAGLLFVACLSVPAAAERIPNPIADFSGLDKITGRITSFSVDIDEVVQFGTLRMRTRACYTRPLTEAPQTDAFVEVQEVTQNGKVQPIFSGWMFAASPGLHGVEHPIYDIWLTGCRQPPAPVQPAKAEPVKPEPKKQETKKPEPKKQEPKKQQPKNQNTR